MLHAIVVLVTLFFFLSSSIDGQDYVKLRLHHTLGAIPSASQALARDSLRLASLSAPVVSGASAGAGQYFVHLHLGTPPQRLRLVADTGSDLVWARCSACRACSGHPPGSAFLPRHSASFRPLHCYHRRCRLVPASSPPRRCNRTRLHSPCRYRYAYADGSTSAGFFSTELATLNASSGDDARLPGLPFGCAFNVSDGAGLAGGAQGVMGLGRGPVSFPSYAGRRFGRTFSYCLMDYTLSPPPTSYLFVGGAAVVLHPRLRFTPLETNPLSPTFYYVRIVAAYVDGEELPIHPSVWALDRETGSGGTVVDSGTTLSFLPGAAYREVVRAVAKQLPGEALTNDWPAGFDVCVNASRRVPRLALQLLGGAKLAPPPRNYFIEAAEGLRCLAVQPAAPSGFGVIGNLMQQGFLFVFDRDASRLGFARTGCAAL